MTQLNEKNLQNGTEIAQSPKMIPERIEKLEIEITHSPIVPLEARYPVVKTVKLSFWLKALIYQISSSEEDWNIVQFFKNCLTSKSSKGT